MEAIAANKVNTDQRVTLHTYHLDQTNLFSSGQACVRQHFQIQIIRSPQLIHHSYHLQVNQNSIKMIMQYTPCITGKGQFQ